MPNPSAVSVTPESRSCFTIASSWSVRRRPDVEVAVRAQQDVVDPALDVSGVGLLVGERQARRARRAAGGVQAVDDG